MSLVNNILYFLILFYIFGPLFSVNNNISWNLITELLNTNNISKINIYEKSYSADIFYNLKNITEYQNLNNTELKLVNNNSSFINKCFQIVNIKEIVYNTKFSKYINYEDKIDNYINNNNLSSIDIYHSTRLLVLLEGLFYNLMSTFFIIFVLQILLKLGQKKGLLAGHTKSPGKLYNSEQIQIQMEDIIGLKETKEEVNQYIDYLSNRNKYIDYGIEIPRGILFIGPPGCGKTLLAKAIANKSGVNFIFVSGSDFNEIFVGVGASRVKNLFKMARKHSPCILFIDEIDSLGQKRSKHVYNTEGSSVLNKLLVEIDGFNNNENILIIGATNRASVLDNALLRSGRFDRKLVFDKPNIMEREELFNLYLKDKVYNIELKKKFNKLAKNTSGLTGADIKTICNQSAIISLRKGNKTITLNHLTEAIEEILIGNKKKERLLSDDEKKRVAYHEAGHCLLGYMMKYSKPPIKVSIIPRGESILGYSQPEMSDQKLYLEKELYIKIIVLLGGRAAESIKFNTISTGAYDDLEKSTKLCYNIVSKYCFNNSLISYNLDKHSDNYKVISDLHREQLYAEMNNIVNKMYMYAEKYIYDNILFLEKIAKFLLENEEIDSDNIENIIGLKNKNIYDILIS